MYTWKVEHTLTIFSVFEACFILNYLFISLWLQMEEAPITAGAWILKLKVFSNLTISMYNVILEKIFVYPNLGNLINT